MSEGAKWTLEAARLGSHKARANVYRMSEVVSHLGAGQPSQFQQIISWLKEAAELGSQQALNDLRVLDLKSYTCAWTKWRHRFCEINDTNGNAILSESELLIRCQGLNADSLDHLVLNDRGHRPIHLAASLGYTKALQDLIGTGVDIDMRNNRGETALLCACRAGHACLARNLLRLGAKARRAKSGETPLHWLIAFDEEEVEEVAKELIAHGAELEQQHVVTESNDYTFDIYPHGTPLDWAVARRKMAAIKILIELGADPFNECSEHSPFVRAVSLHDTEVVKVLVRSAHTTSERLKMLDSTGQSLLFHAIYCNEPYQRILQHGAEAMNAARDTIKILLDGGCNTSCVDKDGDSIMHLAAGFCDADFIEMLLTNFDCVKYINTPCGESARTPIHHAIASWKLEVVKLLLSHGADTSCISKGRTLLHLSVAGDGMYSIQWLKLLDLPNRKDLDALAIQPDAQQGLTAFEMAVLDCKLELADFLLTSGADPRGPKGREPHFLSLLIANPSWDSPSALQYYLLKAAPPFIIRTSSQLSVLHVSASMMTYLADSVTGELKLDLLLKAFSKPSQINARTRRSEGSDAVGGQTPLHYAAEFGVYFAARRLIELGADVAAKDERENSPLDLARMQLEIVRERVMRHEMPRVISDLEDTVKLLEGAVEGRSLPGLRRRPSIGEYTRARFSRLGFQTGSL
jgi:ankyrin repeat protein